MKKQKWSQQPGAKLANAGVSVAAIEIRGMFTSATEEVAAAGQAQAAVTIVTVVGVMCVGRMA